MAGIYIHIPFCKQKCFYCDFYSVSNIKNRKEYLSALKNELELQKDYLENEEVETIYIGGGTPSLITSIELNEIITSLYNNFKVSEKPEITIESNPDDLNQEYLKALISNNINRLSIGIQSFDDNDLKFLNRRHNSEQAVDSVNFAKEAGFRNISVDLIYGLPGMSLNKWEQNIEKAFRMNIQHISAYHLTIEEKTVLAYYLSKGKFRQAEEKHSLEQFKILINKAKENNFIPYEISNFCKSGFFSIHNSNYWKQKKYLGIGASAHSYNLNSRQWNIRNIEKYIFSIENGIVPCENEQLDNKTKYNDYILTSLRTMWGADLNFIKNEFGDLLYSHCLSSVERYIKSNSIILNNGTLILADEAKFISDKIISDLFFID